MKTIIEALQDLYAALGGKSSDVSGLALNSDVIEQIAALVNEGALNELPAVTPEDAGDVLTVDNSGKWGKAAPSGGGGGEPVVLSFTGSSGSWTTENTPEEYTAALTAGVPIFLELNFTSPRTEKHILMDCIIEGSHMYFVSRIGMGASGDKIKLIQYELYTDGSDVYLYDTPYNILWS